MFRVICVDSNGAPELSESEVYSVLHQRVNQYWGNLGYRLLEATPNEAGTIHTEYFDAKRFIPLSNIDEKELSTNKEIYQTI